MALLGEKDNHILRKQEWRLLSGSGATTSLTQESQSLMPSEYTHDTFLVKSFFSETEKYYLVLITNLKQCWCEKLKIEDIRQRSKLSLFVSFDFGLANVQWEFKLSPMLASTGLHGQDPEANLSDDDLFSHVTQKNTKGKSGPKRGRLFLEDSDAEGQDGEDKPEDGEHERNITDVLHGLQGSSDIGAIGMSVMYDHLLLPLISLTNAYRKQIKALEVVIKSKENEVMEALEMLEQNGINYHNRRKATERYDKSWTESKIQEHIEQLVRPQLVGPSELFSDKKIAALCSIITKNAAHQELGPGLPLDNGTLSQGSTSQGSSRRSGGANNASLTLQRDFATIPVSSDTRGADHTSGKTSKQMEELERRRLLQEQLDKEKAAKEKSRKKKKLF
ncbi:hypothetical protein BGZ51_008589 [Haplosporangium sp. Z 767]|nr:hypothetical protein BGZ50_004697 [Haplosporangium sp. Z 11]KAF9194658.1 hypothetical protein BGZ51_008589 [Haplosporangium sp. Z 767]